MMNNRPVKFRVWDKERKEFLNPFWTGLKCDSKDQGRIVLSCPVLYSNWGEACGDDRYTVLQFTGLKDIHGAELFEGDICKYEGDDGKSFSGAVIDFFWGSFRLNEDCIDNFIENEFAAATGLTSLEKIGNAFENPELLKF